MQSKEETVKGTVIEAMPNTLFKVLVGEEREVISYLSGKMRMHKIRVLVGDTVEILEDPYGGKARIVKRL
jgi:translation initiation factor IF-1